MYYESVYDMFFNLFDGIYKICFKIMFFLSAFSPSENVDFPFRLRQKPRGGGVEGLGS